MIPVTQSSFEMVVASLGLSRNEYERSTALREWVQKNKNQRYVPPELLTAWGLEVD
jgi:hypothetical protein